MSPPLQRDDRGRVADSTSASELGRLGGRPPKPKALELPRSDSHATDVLAGCELIESRLVAKGFPATSSWWRETFERWYLSGRRQLVARVGRRGGKSSSFSRLAVAEALFGHHDVPPGDLGWVAIISTDRREAVGRLRTIEAILDALGIEWDPAPGLTHAIQLRDKRVGFRVFTASIRGVSGFTSIFVLCDEVAKWMDADTGSNPATVVLQSVRPTMQTMPSARIALSSSPMARWDAHYDAFEAGETAYQLTAYAPTWEAHPALTEEQTRRDEPDEFAWSREYRAFPADEMLESILTGAELDAVRRLAPNDLPHTTGLTYGAAIDPATRGNAWTLVVVALYDSPYGPVRKVVLNREWRGARSRPLSPRDTLEAVAVELAPYDVTLVWSDQASGDALRELASDAGLTLVVEPWTQASKIAAYSDLVTWVRTKAVELPPDPVLRQDLLGVRRKYSRNGVTIDVTTTPDGRHSDYAPAVAMALSRSLGRQVMPAPELGTQAFANKLREDRKAAWREKQDRAAWMPNGDAEDRGAGAWWRQR